MPTAPNPFDNPELFDIPRLQPEPSQPTAPAHAPVHASVAQTAAAYDPRVDQLNADMATVKRNLDVVIKHLKQQARPADPRPTEAPQVNVRADRVHGATSSGRHVVRIPSLPNAWPYLQVVAFAALILLVIVLLIRQPVGPQPDANDTRAVYHRNVEAVRTGTATLAQQLRDLAKQTRGSQMTAKEVGDKLNESIGRSLMAAAEAPLKSLDDINPWNTDVMADRLESAADAYDDVAKSTERLKR